jgi:hypothetical protein
VKPQARRTKTPRERAEEALGVATRLVSRLEVKRANLQADLAAVSRELEAAEARTDPEQPTTGGEE